MVMIGNFNLNSSMFSGVGGTLVWALFIGSIFVIFMLGLGIYLWSAYQKKVFSMPMSLIMLRKDNSFIENPNCIGGLVKNKQGISTLRIKVPGQWSKLDTGIIPDMSKVGPDNRISILKHGDGSGVYQQCEKVLVTYEDVPITDGNGKETLNRFQLLIKPIPADTKTTTINAIHDVDNILEKNKLSAYAISIIAFIIMAIVQICFLYFTRKRGL